MITKQELFSIAERDYPLDTIYICARDRSQKVTRESKLCYDNDSHSVYTMIKGDSHYQFIYDGRRDRWATIVSSPVSKPLLNKPLPIFN